MVLTTFNSSVLAKSNSAGEVLNLPPSVDFEVTEKKKVDVIVDIGNVNYTTNQINSIINTKLRPQLAAKGIDYNIIVKDTSEGINEIYYEYLDNSTNKGGIYKFDINRKENTTIMDYQYGIGNRANVLRSENKYYDVKNNLLLSTDTQNLSYYDLTTRTDNFRITGSYTSVFSLLYSDGNLLRMEYGSSDYVYAAYYERTRDPITNQITSTRKNYESIFYGASSSGYNKKLKYQIRPNGDLYILSYNINNSQYWDSSLNIYVKNYHNPSASPVSFNGVTTTGELFYLHPESPIHFLDDTHLIIYGRYFHYTTNMYTFSPIAYVYDLTKKQYTRAPQYDELYNYYDNLYRVREYQFEDKSYIRINEDGVYHAKDILSPYEKISSYPSDALMVNFKGIIGNYVLLSSYTTGDRLNGKLYLFNYITEEWILMRDNLRGSYNPVSGVVTTWADHNIAYYKYPVDFNGNKYLVKDVIGEQKHRYDAEVYYVRLDDTLSEQFMSPEQSVGIANLLSENNMTFVGVGSSEAKPYHDNMLKLTDYNGKTILNSSNIEQAFTDVTNFIINKKEIDLHVLDTGTSTFTEQEIKQTLNEIKQELRADNYIVKPNYVKQQDGMLYTMLDSVYWNEYKNNYVLYLDRSTDFSHSDDAYKTLIATQMGNHYAHYIHYGQAVADHVNEVIELLNGRGYYSESTTRAQLKSELKHHFIATAESNPKRHVRKLVLKEDEKTGEFSAEIGLQAYYYDTEGDPQKAERFKTEHNPSIYENHSGLMENTGVYLDSAITRFTKVGKYEIVAQKQDEPTTDERFSNYNLWSEDSLSRLVLYVHRQPIAQFQAYLDAEQQLVIRDLSYDLDYYSSFAKGIIKWNWKYKRTIDENWIYEKPTQLDPTQQYMIALTVQDIDEAWSNETMVLVGENQKPVAYFEVEPSKSSWKSEPTLMDYSYSPSHIPLIEREWKVYRGGQLLYQATTQPTIAQIKQAATTKFLNAVGTYTIQLRVKDMTLQYSEWYTNTFELINYEPIPEFEVEQPLYRDTLTTIDNTTGAVDLDGEPVTFNWTMKKNQGTFTKTGEFPRFAIKDFGLGKQAVGKWEITLSAKDTLEKEGKLTKTFTVLNHPPTSNITGEDTVYLGDTKQYRGNPADEDSEDVASLSSYWKVTIPSGQVLTGYASDMSVSFLQKGQYVLEHWVVDQLDDSSPIYTKVIEVNNKPPKADFTMTPNPTYRDTEVTFKSLAYDEDGYITSYRYRAENEAGVVSLLSNEADFKRTFQSVGQVKITQTVVDDNGDSDSLTKTLLVQNRKPLLTMLYPNGRSVTSPTIISDENPKFSWSYLDLDFDQQQRVELLISKYVNNSEQYLVSLTEQSSQTSLMTSHLSLQDKQLYSIKGRAHDGFEWGEWSDSVYFRVELNEPPVANFNITPKYAYEGDTLTIQHRLSDRDFDELFVQYTVIDEEGNKSYFPTKQTYYVVNKDHYNSFAFYYKSTTAQTITIMQTVSDGKSEVVEKRETVVFHPLTLSADVYHTEQWEVYRQQFNETSKKLWMKHQFYAGEKFMLAAHTTLFNYDQTDTTVFAEKVEMYFPKLKTTIRLNSNGNHAQFLGEYYEPLLSQLDNGVYEMQFKVFYSNGVIKQDNVMIEIIGKAMSFVGVHRMK